MSKLLKLIPKVKVITNTLFTRHLLLTNVSLGCIFMGTGDVIQQLYDRNTSTKPKPYDYKRTGKMFLGGICFGLIGHGWYKFLDVKFPGAHTGSVLRKLFAEVIAGPPLVFTLFVAVGAMENKPFEKSVTEFKENLLYIIGMDWGFYIPLQAINFYYLPPKYRYLYVSAITIVYDVFLSYILHTENESESKVSLKTTS